MIRQKQEQDSKPETYKSREKSSESQDHSTKNSNAGGDILEPPLEPVVSSIVELL